MRFGSEQITAINLENIVKITQNNNNTHRFLKKCAHFVGKEEKIIVPFFLDFFFVKFGFIQKMMIK